MLDLDTLLARCREGDPLAWEALVRRFQGRIYGTALFYLRDREEARDTAQEVFVRVYQHLRVVRDAESFLPWMLRLARNCCVDRLRVLRPGGREKRVGMEIAERVSDAGPSPEDSLIEDTRRTTLHRALATLSEAHREIVLLKDIHQLKLGEIGTLLGLPLGTIKSRSNRARAELAKAVRGL